MVIKVVLTPLPTLANFVSAIIPANIPPTAPMVKVALRRSAGSIIANMAITPVNIIIAVANDSIITPTLAAFFDCLLRSFVAAIIPTIIPRKAVITSPPLTRSSQLIPAITFTANAIASRPVLRPSIVAPKRGISLSKSLVAFIIPAIINKNAAMDAPPLRRVSKSILPSMPVATLRIRSEALRPAIDTANLGVSFSRFLVAFIIPAIMRRNVPTAAPPLRRVSVSILPRILTAIPRISNPALSLSIILPKPAMATPDPPFENLLNDLAISKKPTMIAPVLSRSSPSTDATILAEIANTSKAPEIASIEPANLVRSPRLLLNLFMMSISPPSAAVTTTSAATAPASFVESTKVNATMDAAKTPIAMATLFTASALNLSERPFETFSMPSLRDSATSPKAERGSAMDFTASPSFLNVKKIPRREPRAIKPPALFPIHSLMDEKKPAIPSPHSSNFIPAPSRNFLAFSQRFFIELIRPSNMVVPSSLVHIGLRTLL